MCNRIDDYIWKVKLYLMRKYGVDRAERAVDPLKWYIETGRAPTSFLKDLQNVQPFMIGRLLYKEKDGSVDMAISSFKQLVEKYSKSACNTT